MSSKIIQDLCKSVSPILFEHGFIHFETLRWRRYWGWKVDLFELRPDHLIDPLYVYCGLVILAPSTDQRIESGFLDIAEIGLEYLSKRKHSYRISRGLKNLKPIKKTFRHIKHDLEKYGLPWLDQWTTPEKCLEAFMQDSNIPKRSLGAKFSQDYLKDMAQRLPDPACLIDPPYPPYSEEAQVLFRRPSMKSRSEYKALQ